ncbi:hypothetical protein COLO4_36028 [Corchorus olitorius]|uniref:MRH domain-containing protein n=1 Tax=Corchorus olitorius TaxID=93759 RepID=A0A1R3GBF3_9ROSI|nr:hypothetical protein COLO4_36028 [Corchorus olitorius]
MANSNPLTNLRCHHCAGPLSKEMETSEWTVAPLVRDSFSMIGSAVGGTTSAFYGFNHVMPIVRRWVKGPMWVHFLIGAPPVIVFSSACAGLTDEDYFKGEIIKCKNGAKKFTRIQLNDDFCDCPDGTDEPDCCDGSDEYDGKVKCPNTCWEAGNVARDKLKKKIEMYHEGVALRKQEIQKAKQAIARDNAELLGLKNEKEVLQKLVKQLEEQIQKLEQKERLEKEDKMKDAFTENVENEKSGPEENVDSQKEALKISHDEKWGFQGKLYPISLSVCGFSLFSNFGLSYLRSAWFPLLALFQPYIIPHSISCFVAFDCTIKDYSREKKKESTEGLSREELGRLVASRWTGKKTEDQVGEINTAKSDKEESAEDDHQEKGRNDAGDENSVSGTEILSHQSWLDKIQEAAQNLLQSVSLFSAHVANLDLNQVRDEYNNYTARLSDIESRILCLTEKFKYDFGIEKEFYLFYDHCFESKQDKYVYKVCPFKRATQEEGSSETRLGNWEKFGNSYRMMLFTNGEGCWNGPDRSLKVKLRCGLKTELTGVDEPSRCEYVALLYTPALCLEQKLKEFEQKLESMYKEQPGSHDEL